jgi:hypothetical protein
VSDLQRSFGQAEPVWARGLIERYAQQLKIARDKYGVYPGATLLHTSATVPVTSFSHGWVLLTYWQRIGEDMVRQAVEDYKKTLSSHAQKAAEKTKPVVDRFQKNVSEWLARWAVASISGRDVQRAVELWTLIERHAVALSGAAWSGYNIETSSERALVSLKETFNDLAVAAKDFGGRAAGFFWPVLKWGAIGIGGLALVYVVVRARRS